MQAAQSKDPEAFNTTHTLRTFQPNNPAFAFACSFFFCHSWHLIPKKQPPNPTQYLILLPRRVQIQPSIQKHPLVLVLWITIPLATIIFLLRGPLRASSEYANDFAAPYTSARLWLRHQNPYDSTTFLPTWQAAGAPLAQPDGTPIYANPSSTHSVYPPPSVVVLSPFALLPWATAWLSMILLSTALYLTALLLLTRLLPETWRDPYRPAFLTFGLLLAPTQSALHVSNVTCLSAALLLIALYLLLRRNLVQRLARR